jgi:hypothetical protein
LSDVIFLSILFYRKDRKDFYPGMLLKSKKVRKAKSIQSFANFAFIYKKLKEKKPCALCGKKIMCKKHTYFNDLQEGTGHLYFSLTLNCYQLMVRMLKLLRI